MYPHDIVEQALFGMGEVSIDFFRFKEASSYFAEMPCDRTVVDALVGYCHEDFRAFKATVDDTRFYRQGRRFHYYLFHYLRYLDANVFWLRQNYEQAESLYQDILRVTTKIGWPRLQVRALRGLSNTYSTYRRGDPGSRTYDLVRAAKCAAQGQDLARTAEYKVGGAYATYDLGVIYAGMEWNDVAGQALRSAEQTFARLGHRHGLDLCRSAIRRYL
jgi:hypothetical protein